MPKLKQKQLTGMETPKDTALSKKVEEYAEAASAFAKQRHVVTGLREQVLALMHDRKLEVYDDPELDVVISITEKETLAMKKRAGEDEDEGDEDRAA